MHGRSFHVVTYRVHKCIMYSYAGDDVLICIMFDGNRHVACLACMLSFLCDLLRWCSQQLF